MSARPLASVAPAESLRVIKGRRLRRPAVAPWMIVVLIAVLAFLGLGFARTSLDNSAFELAELDKAIRLQTEVNRRLTLEIARLENPARIAPLAEELGLVIPDSTSQLLVDLAPDYRILAGVEEGRASQ